MTASITSLIGDRDQARRRAWASESASVRAVAVTERVVLLGPMRKNSGLMFTPMMVSGSCRGHAWLHLCNCGQLL
jgi:hypothetical protein